LKKKGQREVGTDSVGVEIVDSLPRPCIHEFEAFPVMSNKTKSIIIIIIYDEFVVLIELSLTHQPSVPSSVFGGMGVVVMNVMTVSFSLVFHRIITTP